MSNILKLGSSFHALLFDMGSENSRLKDFPRSNLPRAAATHFFSKFYFIFWNLSLEFFSILSAFFLIVIYFCFIFILHESCSIMWNSFYFIFLHFIFILRFHIPFFFSLLFNDFYWSQLPRENRVVKWQWNTSLGANLKPKIFKHLIPNT